jgi:hypothetical protein
VEVRVAQRYTQQYKSDHVVRQDDGGQGGHSLGLRRQDRGAKRGSVSDRSVIRLQRCGLVQACGSDGDEPASKLDAGGCDCVGASAGAAAAHS